MIKFEYTYCVMYSSQLLTGRIQITTNTRIKNFDEIKDIERIIGEKNGCDNVIITNWKLLKFRVRLGG
jgi:hypothetical protein